MILKADALYSTISAAWGIYSFHLPVQPLYFCHFHFFMASQIPIKDKVNIYIANNSKLCK